MPVRAADPASEGIAQAPKPASLPPAHREIPGESSRIKPIQTKIEPEPANHPTNDPGGK